MQVRAGRPSTYWFIAVRSVCPELNQGMFKPLPLEPFRETVMDEYQLDKVREPHLHEM